MRGWIATTLVVAMAGCGGSDSDSGPFSGVDVVREVEGNDLGGPVDVVRDRFGIAHVYAENLDDLAFVHGYIMAADRLPQMDLFRHFANGTIAELFGSLEQEQIDTDLEMRIHRMKPLAQESWTTIQESTDPDDQGVAAFMQRYSDGINAYLADLKAGEYVLDSAVRVWFDPDRAEPWSPVDSLAIGRLQAWSLSYEDRDIDMTDDYQQSVAKFDQANTITEPERARRAGAFFDLFPLAPMDPASTITDFPAGSSSATAKQPAAQRPTVPTQLLRQAKDFFRHKKVGGMKLKDHRNGSNNWVLGPQHTGGKTILSNDPHLQLSSPSIFYAVHLTVPDRLDISGITFPGIPGVILGHNEHVAWGATTVNHDVSDFYLETIVPCSTGGGDCVMFEGSEVAIETWQEEIRIGALGTFTDSKTVTYERVPHHGPIVPTIVDHDLAPRAGNQAISVRYTGHQPTFELSALWHLWTAANVDEAKASFQNWGFGSQNFVFADDQGSIGWTSHGLVPWRTNGCFTFDALSNPGGTAPWFVLPGDGTCEWDGFMPGEYIPNAKDPSKGYLASANQDPIGANANGDPLDRPIIDGHLHYLGWIGYAEGFRLGRITRRIEALIASGNPLTMDDMGSIQADTFSNYGDRMSPHVVSAVEAMSAEAAAAGTHPDLSAFVSGLSTADRARLVDASARIAAWSFETPPAMRGTPTADEIRDSSATVIFNLWALYFIQEALGDEALVLGYGTGTYLANTANQLLNTPGTLRTGVAAETGEPVLCDDLGTAGTVESCRLMVLMALDKALDWASGPIGFSTTDMDDWRWGDLHRLTLEALVPADELSVPPPGDPDPLLRGGYPRAGDTFSVDASSPGFGDADFTYDHGPAMRHITEFTPGQAPVTRLAMPGGQIYDRDTTHFRDLMDDYWSVNEYFVVPQSTSQIIEAAEGRWRFTR